VETLKQEPRLLNLNKLSLSLGGHKFLFNLQLKAGECIAISGESGAGKSTLLNLIAGFTPADSGSLHWHNTELSRLLPAQRPITTLFQDHNLFSHLNVIDNLGLGINPSLKLTTSDRERLRKTLDLLGLAGFEQRLPAQLSGGQAQRVALARSLLRNKPILLLDEPYSSLDEATRHNMLGLTKEVIADKQLCALIVTHNRQDARALGAKTLLLSNGKLSPI
jgi:thiamine transport system ATP-binding protein